MAETRIVSDPNVMLGKPVVEGTRITVEYILEELAHGQPIDVLVDSHPTLSKQGVYAALEYAVKVLRSDIIEPVQATQLPLTFIADENVESHIVEQLIKLGHTVHHSAGHLSAGAPDEDVLDLSAQTGAILITSDKDFGELVFRRLKENSGVLLMRLAGLSPSEKTGVVSALVTRHQEDLRDSFTVLSRSTVRIRRRD